MKKTILTFALIAFSIIGFSQEKNEKSSNIIKKDAQINNEDSLEDEYKEAEFQGEEESDTVFLREDYLDKKTIADPKKK